MRERVAPVDNIDHIQIPEVQMCYNSSMNSYFSYSRPIHADPVYTSCSSVKIKFSGHFIEDAYRDPYHGPPIWIVADTLRNPTEVMTQENGRTYYMGHNGYAVIVSAVPGQIYHSVVTSFLPQD